VDGIQPSLDREHHAGDNGSDGILTAVRHLRSAGLVFAGSGANLAESLAPGYLDTLAGRVAPLAVTSQFKPGEPAGEKRPDAAGRPGCAAAIRNDLHR